MHHFYQRNGQLQVEGVAVKDLAKKHGTPLYIYSAQTLTDHFNRLETALAPLDHRICFATKANSNLALLALLAKRGSGFDVTTAGELYRVRQAGGASARCTFVGVGKTRAEIEQGLRAGVYSFIVESEHEMRVINEIAGRLKKKAPVAVRVNPNVDAKTHAKITTGTYANKFGIAYEEIPGLYARAAKLKNLWLRGVQMHIGSQITDVKPFVLAVQKMLPLVLSLKAKHHIEFFDIGGGMGIIYTDALASGQPGWWKKRAQILRPELYAEKLVPLLQPLGLKILVEPGRYLVGNAGILVTEVLYIKKTGKKHFVIVDAAMNDLIRPTLYESYHEIVPVTASRSGTKWVSSDVVGPICESGDYLAKDRDLPPVQAGDLLAAMSAGAYGMAMASNYNARPRAAEILVEGKKARVVRKRETLADLVRGESV
jgi:diaminopimelate decarboxylase